MEAAYRQAATAIATADALLIGAGAGMGVDSGLPDFRGPEGFWRAYPAFRGRRFEEISNPVWFRRDPEQAWGFFGHRLNLYRATTPHAGFEILRRWGESRPLGCFVYTSNVDGHFHGAGFPPERIVECHGSIRFLQCVEGCSDAIWSAEETQVSVEENTVRARPPLPACVRCGGLARPNVLMFGDGGWVPDRCRSAKTSAISSGSNELPASAWRLSNSAPARSSRPCDWSARTVAGSSSASTRATRRRRRGALSCRWAARGDRGDRWYNVVLVRRYRTNPSPRSPVMSTRSLVAWSVSVSLLISAVVLFGGLRAAEPSPAAVEGKSNPAAEAPPRELAMQALPDYRIQPPDVIQIEMLKLIPLPPYRAGVFDVLQIRAYTPPDVPPVNNYYMVEAEGQIDLGPPYGTVRVAGMTHDEIVAALNQKLKEWLKDPATYVQLARVAGAQPVTGQYLVAPDGTVNLRQYGLVSVTGKTVTEARMAIQEHLSQFLEAPIFPSMWWPTTARRSTSSSRVAAWATMFAACPSPATRRSWMPSARSTASRRSPARRSGSPGPRPRTVNRGRSCRSIMTPSPAAGRRPPTTSFPRRPALHRRQEAGGGEKGLSMSRDRILTACAPGIVVLISLFAPPACWAAVEAPWNLPALSARPEDILRAAAASPAPKDGDVEMLFEEHVYELDEQGREHRTSRRIYRFLTDKGVDDWSCTEADWSPWCEEKPIFRVRVITPDGQAHALDQESIGEAAAEQDTPNIFSDEKLLRAPLPAIVVGAVVEEEIETKEIRPLFDHGIVERFLLAQQYPVRKLRLVIDAPATLPLKYEVIACNAAPARTEDKGRTRLVFELGPLPATAMPEDYLPAENAKLPQVVFSTGKSWNDVAAAYSDLVESHLDMDAVRPLAEKAIGGETDRTRSSSGCWPRYGARSATRAWSSARGRSCRVLARDAGPPLRRLQGPGHAPGGDAPRGRYSRPGGPAADRTLRRRHALAARAGRLRPRHRLHPRGPADVDRPFGPLRPGRLSAADRSGPLGHARQP